MGLNKRKVLDAAQKYLQKGNLDRALKEYQKVLDADPRDTNVRLKVGDVQLRRGKSEEAIEAYFEVAKQFMKDGFDAKAVALFKQITKIDEKRYDIYEPLAELYQRLGLLSEAMGALQTAAEAHQREGRKTEGLALLRKMASLDPSNTSTRMKIAQLLWKEELRDEALEEYDEVVAELGRQGDLEGAVRVHEQVLSDLPERLENLVGLGTLQLELNHAEQAEPPLLKATEVAVESVEAWEALARVHEALGRQKEFEDTWKTVAAIYKDRGDEDRAKEILQLYVTPQALDSTSDGLDGGLDAEAEAAAAAEADDLSGGQTIGDLAGDDDADDELEIGDGASLGADADLDAPEPEAPAAEAAPELDLDEEIDIELDDEVDAPEEAEGAEPVAPVAPAAAGEDTSSAAEAADPTQLLAEAGVYLRYSQHDKALGCFEQILEIEPKHREALEKLGETHCKMEAPEKAVPFFREAALEARTAGDSEEFDRLCELLRGVDEAAAEALAADALTPEPELDLDLELEFDTPSGDPELSGVADQAGLDVEVEMLLNEPEEAAEPPAPDFADPGEDDLELDVEADVAEGADVEPATADADAPEEELAPELGDEADEAPELDAAAEVELGEADASVGADEPAGDEEASAAPALEKKTGGVTLGASSQASDVSAEDLEEAEFYYRQGLYDEAEQLLQRLLEAAPGHPQVLLRLGEIAKSRGECPSSPVSEGVDFDRTEEETSPGLDAGALEQDAEESETLAAEDTLSGSTLEDLDALPDLDGPEAGPDDETLQAELSDALPELDESDEEGVSLEGATLPVEDTAASAESEAEPAEEPREEPARSPAPTAEVPASPVAAEPAAPVAAAGSDEGFDLAAELSGVFDDSTSGAEGEATLGGTTQAGFESIFQSFKQGVKETLGDGEEETHYDLGIAYREMGLFEDAIGEFAAAMTAPARKVDCLAMMGLCAMDLGRANDAVGHLEQALALPDLAEDRIAGLRFDLGAAFEMQGDLDRARAAWEQVLAFDPDFPEVAERLEKLGQEDSTPSLGEMDPAEGGLAEAFESFDDLIAEAEADDDDDDPDGDDDPGAGPDGGGESDGDMGSTQWGRKVSYG